MKEVMINKELNNRSHCFFSSSVTHVCVCGEMFRTSAKLNGDIGYWIFKVLQDTKQKTKPWDRNTNIPRTYSPLRKCLPHTQHIIDVDSTVLSVLVDLFFWDVSVRYLEFRIKNLKFSSYVLSRRDLIPLLLQWL